MSSETAAAAEQVSRAFAFLTENWLRPPVEAFLLPFSTNGNFFDDNHDGLLMQND